MRLPGSRHGTRPGLRASDPRAEGRTASSQPAAADESADPEGYRLVSIDAVHAPSGCTGGDWHLYRIVQGENGITGYRRGDLERVSADVATIVTALNGRREWARRGPAAKRIARSGS